MSLYALLRPCLMALDAETAHRATLRLLATGIGPAHRGSYPSLAVKVFGRDFPNPLGLAAGFDKDAEALPALLRMGFGFVEAGTVTPRPQPGNPRPRVFRDAASCSVINRMGFPGKGLDIFAANLERTRKSCKGLIGANIGINKDTASPVGDYETCLKRVAALADYVTVNVSSPNTAGLRDLQNRDELDALLGTLSAARPPNLPLLLKVAPDLDTAQRKAIAEVALKHKVSGLIVSNTTVTRPPALTPHLREEKGGLSGKLLFSLSTETLADFYRLTGGALPLIGAGGISGPAEAYAKIRAGASLLQLYTGLVFEGPALIPAILKGLTSLLARDGFTTLTKAIGADHAGRTAAKAAI